MIRDIERKALMAGGSGGNVDLSGEDLQRIADRVRQLLQANQPPAAVAPPRVSPDELARMIDHTLLKPEATAADIEKLCDEAKRHQFFSVCVNPTYVAQCRSLLRGSPVKLCCVVGFPLGAQSPEIKAMEARKAIREGAGEIDMVINIGALKSKDEALVFRDIRAVVEACKDGRALSKVIFETALLTDEEKVRACEYEHEGRRRLRENVHRVRERRRHGEDIALMAKTVAPKKLGVKASAASAPLTMRCG